MKIVHVASELFPYIKTGGLADAVGSLASTLAGAGHEVSVFIPGYNAIFARPDARAAERVLRLKIEMGDTFISGDVKVFSPRPNLRIFTVCREEFFDRQGAYGNGERDYEDNYLRYIFFCKGTVEALRTLGLQADIVHAHDWQAALLPLLLRHAESRHGTTLALKTVFTIHNIAFQGLFPMRAFFRTNLPDELQGIDGLEYFGQMSFMKGGILFADRVTTVSPRYAREIQTPEYGCGLDGVVASRAEDLCGLLNGIDPAVWNPATDAHLPANYTPGDMAGKAVCRAALLKKTGLAPADARVPVFGMVCRLTAQKGVRLVLDNRGFFLKHDCRLVVLGAGDRRLEGEVRALAAGNPGKIAHEARLDEALSHLIEAGCDFFVMPSMFEPCGLNQLYSQAYGTPPLVTRVGGLADTVTDIDENPADGTGILFPPTVAGLRGGLHRAMSLFADKPALAATRERGMRRDYSWAKAARA
ncbi:MAG: glycogen synthase GlgA, partial [Opitutaceae bacterium]|nr:glycogen synthase GlgA [Opitutaceae bacterium]